MNEHRKSIGNLLKRILLVALCLVMALGTAVTIMAATFNGDLDGDGKVTAYDAQLLAEYQAGERDLDPATVIGLTVRGIIDRVLGRVVDEPVVDDGVVEKTVEVETADGVVTEALTFTEENVTVTVPEGVKVTGESLTLTVTKKDASDGGVTPEEGQELLPLDIHIDGVAEDNTTAIVICVAGALDTGLNLGNVTLYHVENGVTNPMTQVMDVAELTAHNTFYYDPATGDISVAMASFSEITMISDTDKAWGGSIAQGFAGGDGTEEAPYLIANADQLAYMSQLVSGDEAAAEAHYKLISDVNMNGEYAQKNDRKDLMFYPIGYWAKQVDENGAALKNSAGEEYYGRGNTFTGVFDGNGNTIANIYQNTWLMDGTYDYGYWNTAMGLFGAVYGATIKNLTMDNFQCDGETAPVGCIATYAGGPDMLFENIQLTNCNPRTYNVACGGIAGYNYNSTSGTADEITFLNITVDQTNKISALYGSYGVSGGSLLGRLRENSRHDGTNNADQINQVIMENCHMATIMDVNNDCCSNYQWYLYCYAGMVIGTVDYLDEVPGVSVEDVIKASNCTVTYGDWNEYWYCELVKNTIASYTHDHQFGRLTEIDSVSEIQDENGNWNKEGGFVIANEDNTEAECYHIFKHSEGYLYRHFHDVEDETNPDVHETTDVNGDGVIDSDLLKEDHQCYYIPFNQLWIGYNRGCKPMYEFEGIEFVDGGTVKSRPKFEAKDVSAVATNTPVKVGDLFESVVYESELSKSTLSVFVSPVGENSTAAGTFSRDLGKWEDGTLTFSGTGLAKVVITDYFYCTEKVLYVSVVSELKTVEKWVKVTDASTLTAGDQLVIASDRCDKVAGVLDGEYLTAVEASFVNGVMADNADAVVFTLGGTEGAWTLTGTSGALGATAKGKLAWDSGTCTWSISVADGDAVIANTTASYGSFRYNTSAPRFNTYTSEITDLMQLPQLYRLEETIDCAHAGKTTKTTVEATCTEVGTVIVTCNECGAKIDQSEIPMVAHNYVDGVCSECGKQDITETTTVTFEFGDNSNPEHKDGSDIGSTKTYTEGQYTLTITDAYKVYDSAFDAKGNSALKLGTGDYAGKFAFTVPEEVTSVIIKAAGYKAATCKITINGTAHEITKLSNNGEYNEITVDTSATKTVSLEVTTNKRAMIDSVTYVIGETSGEETCQHANTTTNTVDATCTEAGSVTVVCSDCGETVSTETINALGHTWQDATCEVLKTCTVCGATEGELAEHSYVDGVCSVCGAEQSTTVEMEKTYIFSNYAAGTQYAMDEVHTLDDYITVTTNDCHFTSELRIYSSTTNNGYAIIDCDGSITDMSFNAGNKVDTLNVYGSNDNGATWTLIQGVSITSTSYKDYTVDFGDTSYSWLKLDVAGTNQVRVKSMTLVFNATNSDGTTGGEQTAGQWTLVTDIADLTAGDKIVITNADGDQALSTAQNSNNRGQTSVTKSGDTITFAENAGVQQITLEAGTTSGSWAFNVGSGYLYAASSGSNYLRTESTLSANSSWTITITNGTATVKAQGTNTRNWLRYNSSSSIFSCYASGQGDICIYKWVEETP